MINLLTTEVTMMQAVLALTVLTSFITSFI